MKRLLLTLVSAMGTLICPRHPANKPSAILKIVLCAILTAYTGMAAAQTDSLYYGEDSCYTLQIKIYDDHAELEKFEVVKQRITTSTLVFPAYIDDKPVTKICDEMCRGYSGGHGYSYDVNEIIIPNTVVEIGNEAFASLYSLDKITFASPSSLKKIGNLAFADIWYGPETIELPETVEEIGEQCFLANNYLEVVKLPSKLKTIPYGAFASCESLRSCYLPQTVESIGDEAFYWCDELSVELPESLKTIGQYAFAKSGMRSVTVPQNVTSIGNYAFRGSYLREITLPDGLTKISNGLFRDCENLKSVYIPDNVTSIGQEAFYQCKKLEKADIPDGVTYIGPDAFYWCEKLTSIKLPSKLTSVQPRTFYYCKSIKSIDIPENVVSIGNRAFSGCGDNNTICITMPACVTSIGDEAFNLCRVESIDLSDSLRTIGANALPRVNQRYYVIPPLVTSIGEGAFPVELEFIVMEPEHYVDLEKAIDQRWIKESYFPKKCYVTFAAKADYDSITYKIAQEGVTAYDPKADKEIAGNQYYTFRNKATGQYLQLSANGEAETALVDKDDMRRSAGAQIRLIESGTANKYYLSIQNVADPMLGTINFKGGEAWIDHPAFRQWNLMVDGEYMAVDDKGNFVKTGTADDNADWYISPATEFEVEMTDGYDGKSYASIYLPFDVQSEGDSHIYVATTSDEQSVTMTKLTDDKLKNSEGGLLVNDNGAETVTLQITSRAQAPETNLLTGSCEDKFSVSAQDEYFGLDYAASDGIGMYSLETPVLKANTAYLPRNAANGNAIFLKINLQETTGINHVEISDTETNGLIYDIQGRIIPQKPQKGIYIMNGKKYLGK